MKRLFALLITIIMVASLAACGTNNSNTNENNSSANGNESGGTVENAMIPGTLNFIELDDRDPSVLRGLRIISNRVGSSLENGINALPSSVDNIRCIFELNEWVYFYPDTDATYGLRVWILKHRDDQGYYNTAKFSDLDPNFANYCDLHYPEDAENPDETEWGSFYLHPEECEPGYYDFVFTYEGKAIATLLTRFYNENELTDKSDAELEALINNERIAAGGSADGISGNGAPSDNTDNGNLPEETNENVGSEIPENVFYAFQDAVGSDGDTWPTAEMWASIGLPALDYTESGENVLLMIANDSLSVTGYADNETLADTLKDLAAMLTDAGLAVDTVNTLTGGEQHVADYEYNGIPLQIRIGSNATAQINIFVSVNQY